MTLQSVVGETLLAQGFPYERLSALRRLEEGATCAQLKTVFRIIELPAGRLR